MKDTKTPSETPLTDAKSHKREIRGINNETLMSECSKLSGDARAINLKHGAFFVLNRAWSEMSEALRELEKPQPEEAR